MVVTPNNFPSVQEIRALLGTTPHASKSAIARRLLNRFDDHFDREALDALFESLPYSGPDWIEETSRSPAASYLRAKLLAAAGKLDQAADEWARFFNSSPIRDPLILLQSIQLLAGMKRFSDAALQLRELFRTRPGYSLHARSDKLVKRVWERCPPQLRKCRIAILGSSTTSLLIPVLRNLCFRDGIDAEFYEAPYGNFRQEILDPQSGIYKFKPNISFLITHWRDLRLPPVSANEASQLGRMVDEVKDLWKRLSEGCGSHVVHQASDYPPEDSYGYLANSLPGGRGRMIALMNQQLTSEAPDYVSVLDTPSVVAVVGIEAWSNPSLWYTAKQHPALKALPNLAEAQIAHIRAVLGLTRKVVVCDLDNTLWGGVIGEDGLQGIRIGPASAEGEAYADLQRYLLDLKSRGVLLAVCSKNNPEDARLPFLEHKHMILKLEDFAAFVANWNDKAANLKALAAQLSLGTDSFVFLDDNPMERAWIRSQMPDVAVVELSSSPFYRVRDLHQGYHFFSLQLSTEDKQRGDLYRVEAERDTVRTSSGSLHEFLEKLTMRATVGPLNPENIARVTQLTNKTNQFNLTTRRFTQPEIEQWVAKKNTWIGVYQLEDKYGDYGIIGLIFCAPAPETDSWEIGLWLMSCRVLGRQMEDFMFDRLVEAAKSAGIRKLIGVFRPTAKNSQVADLYPRFGFTEIAGNQGERRFALEISKNERNFCTFIQNANPTERSGKESVHK